MKLLDINYKKREEEDKPISINDSSFTIHFLPTQGKKGKYNTWIPVKINKKHYKKRPPIPIQKLVIERKEDIRYDINTPSKQKLSAVELNIISENLSDVINYELEQDYKLTEIIEFIRENFNIA